MTGRPDLLKHQAGYGPADPYVSVFLHHFASTASPPYQATGYDDGFRMICVYLCVTAVSPEFCDGAGGVWGRETRAIDQLVSARIVVKVVAVCRGFVSVHQ